MANMNDLVGFCIKHVEGMAKMHRNWVFRGFESSKWTPMDMLRWCYRWHLLRIAIIAVWFHTKHCHFTQLKMVVLPRILWKVDISSEPSKKFRMISSYSTNLHSHRANCGCLSKFRLLYNSRVSFAYLREIFYSNSFSITVGVLNAIGGGDGFW